MRQILISLILFIVIDSAGQDLLNRKGRRLTTDEFSELKKQKDIFVPPDLKTDTIVIVKYTATRLAQLLRTARNEEFARNGEDTTGYKDEKFHGKKQTEHSRRVLEKFSNDYPEQQFKSLKKKGIRAVILEETAIRSDKRYWNKIWLTTVYVCRQDEFHGPWATTSTNRFYDPQTDKNYDFLRVSNYEVIDLLE